MEQVLAFRMSFKEAARVARVLKLSNSASLNLLGERLQEQLSDCQYMHARISEAKKAYLEEKTKRTKRKLP